MNLPTRSSKRVTYGLEDYRSQLTQATTKDEALEVAVKAAETAMQALRVAKDDREKDACSTRLKQLLQHAEQLKSSEDWRREVLSLQSLGGNQGTQGSVSKVLKEPVSTRSISKAEQILLLKGGYLNGCKFPPWSTAPTSQDFERLEGEALFTDEADLHLSDAQEDVLDGWKRPRDALPPPSWFPDNGEIKGPSMTFSKTIDLVQDAATDCSVVASLCAGTARAERGHAKLLRNVVFPYDQETGRPAVSNNGKYIFRLNFNGCYRKVIVDDRLPVSKTSRVIHVVDRHNPGLLWPALMEKAYLKVRGGYDFPGSNSGTDLWVLTGWIPEQIFLQSDELEPDRLWRRMRQSFDYGDVLVTMGTGKISPDTERELGLAGEHDYAVLDLQEVHGQRLMLVRNPWCEGTSWRKSVKAAHESDAKKRSPGQFGSDKEPVRNSRDLLNANDQLSPGTFWIDVDSIMQHFESIYLNWNPGLFSQRQDFHFTWDLSAPEAGQTKPRGRSASLRNHPQFTITAAKGDTIWVLLCRHFRNAISEAAMPADIECGRYDIDLQGHIALYSFSSYGRRVLLPEKFDEKGWYVDSPQTLLKLNGCEAGRPYTIVPLEQDLAAAIHTFTISAFSNSAITLSEATKRYAHSRTLCAAWTRDTAGGNAHSPAYCTNPQFAITVPVATGMSLLLEAMNEELNVHVKLVHGRAQRITSIRNRDIVFDSKDYRRGCCAAEIAKLEAGQYTIICSTFEPQQLSNFSLLVESAQAVHVLQLPREGAGRLRVPLRVVALKAGQNKVAMPLVPKRLARMYAIARIVEERRTGHPSKSGRSLLRMTIEVGHGPDRHILSTSGGGEYTDGAHDVRMEDIDVAPDIRRHGTMWLVLERMHSSVQDNEQVAVELFLDQPDAVACGEWGPHDD